MSNEITKKNAGLLERTINYVSNNRKTLSYVGIAALVIGLVAYSIVNGRAHHEITLSGKINTIEQKLQSLRTIETPSIAQEADLNNAVEELQGIYENNKSFDNGVRALFLAAKISYEQSDQAKALELFNQVYDSGKSLLAPMAGLFAAITHENQQEFKQAVELLEEVSEKYPLHFSAGEVLLALGRNQMLMGDPIAAEKTWTQITETEDYQASKSKAKEYIDLLRLTGKGFSQEILDAKASTLTPEGLNPVSQ